MADVTPGRGTQETVSLRRAVGKSMYAIGPVDPPTACRFEGLTPFEVRPLLRDLAAHDRVHAVGATMMGQPVGLALAVRGRAEPGTSSGALPVGSARLLTLAVARRWRRIGIGRALLAALESSLAAEGVTALACRYALPASESRAALEALFQATGWSAPVVTMYHCRAGRSMLEAPLVRRQLDLPPEYEIVDWVDLTTADRERIAGHRGAAGWFPDTLDPFHFEPGMEIGNSLALRYHGEVVGWLINRRTGPTTMYYQCLYVREDLARLGRGFALMGEAIRRHAAAIGGRDGLGEWSTPAALKAMVRFIERHLVPFGAEVTEQREVQKAVGGAGAGGAPARRSPRATAARVPLLSSAECAAVVAELEAARALWIPRAAPIAFHTFGVVAAMDAFPDPAAYREAAVRVNAELTKRFGWLYDRVCAALAERLGAPVTPREGWALPAFHMVSPTRGAAIPVAPVHADIAHRDLEPCVGYDSRPLSFVLCLARRDTGAGLTEWDLTYQETAGLDTEETARMLDAAPQAFHPLADGELLSLSGDVYRQRAPLAEAPAEGARVTLEGQVVPWQGGWGLFG